jgi:hypothetical protein
MATRTPTSTTRTDTTRTNEASRQTILGQSVVGGLIAGAILAAAMMIYTAAAGMGAGAPWQLFASVLLGAPALQALTFGVFLVGFIVHFVLSALFGLIWGFAAAGVPKSIRDGLGSHGAAAGIFGLVLWVVNVQLIARGFYPWFLEMNQLVFALAHVLFFGLPLGLYLASRLQPMEGVPVRRGEATRV